MTGGDTHHYTIVESIYSSDLEIIFNYFEFEKQRKLNQGGKIPDQYIIALSIAVIIVIIIIIFWSFLLANIKVWRERVIFGKFFRVIKPSSMLYGPYDLRYIFWAV